MIEYCPISLFGHCLDRIHKRQKNIMGKPVQAILFSCGAGRDASVHNTTMIS